MQSLARRAVQQLGLGGRRCRPLTPLNPEHAVSSCADSRSSSTRSSSSGTAAAVAAAKSKASASMGPSGRPCIRGVVFDMDGTLTVPVIDFALMRQRCGIHGPGDILDVINTWPEDQRKQAYAVIQDMEEQALQDMDVMPGALDLCNYLDIRGLPRGLITRNVMRSVEFFHNRFNLTPFLPAISRECAFPYKPHPGALLHIASQWGVAPGEVVMVGDSVKDDIVSGNRAGVAVTILLDWQAKQGYRAEQFEGEQRPHYVVHDLSEVRLILEQHYDLPRGGDYVEQLTSTTGAP